MAKFEIFYPVRPYAINQAFGVNGDYYRKNGINILGHNGVDLRASHGQAVLATHDGIAYFQTDSSSGEGVVIISNEPFDYKGKQAWFKSVYWHLCDYAKEPKFKSPVLDYQQKNKSKPLPVKRGDVIGYADSTGLSTGDHLHFSLKPMVPSKVLPPSAYDDATDVGIGNWVNLEQNTGYLGAIDPTPYFNGRYADEKPEIVEADKIVDAIENLKKVETPVNKSLIASITASLWASFLALFTPRK